MDYMQLSNSRADKSYQIVNLSTTEQARPQTRIGEVSPALCGTW